MWHLPSDTTVLIEPVDPDHDREALTARVVDDDHLLLDLGASPRPTQSIDVVASFFTPDALLRVTGLLDPGTGRDGIFELFVTHVERVERRLHQRVRVALHASVVVPDAAGPFRSVLVTTRDVSSGGCSIVADRALPAGSDAVISLEVDGEDPVVAQASVLARDEPGPPCCYRLMFTEIDEADRARLGRLATAA